MTTTLDRTNPDRTLVSAPSIAAGYGQPLYVDDRRPGYDPSANGSLSDRSMLDRPMADRFGTDRTGRPEPQLDQLRFWVGAVIAACIAGVLGGLGILVAHTIVHIPVLLGGAAISALTYAVVVGFIALGVAAMYNALLYVAPHPAVFFAWLVGAGALVATVLPFTATAALGSAIAFAAVNLLVGLVVICLVPLAAVRRS